MKSPPSKIVQLVSHTEGGWGTRLFALCDDGSVWVQDRVWDRGWELVSAPHKPEGDGHADPK